MFHNKIITFKQTKKEIESVTVDSVNKCIKQYFVLDNMSIALAGNIE